MVLGMVNYRSKVQVLVVLSYPKLAAFSSIDFICFRQMQDASSQNTSHLKTCLVDPEAVVKGGECTEHAGRLC